MTNNLKCSGEDLWKDGGLFTVQDIAKDHDLPGEVLKFDITNLEK